jgi:DNA invertase Pin-like site-specific DNA recombinase
VVKADRLGRSTRDVLNIVHELETKGASLRVLDPAIDTAGPMGKMVLTVLGMVGEMELTIIRERQRAGIAKAKAEGRYKGRPGHGRPSQGYRNDRTRSGGCRRCKGYRCRRGGGRGGTA